MGQPADNAASLSRIASAPLLELCCTWRDAEARAPNKYSAACASRHPREEHCAIREEAAHFVSIQLDGVVHVVLVFIRLQLPRRGGRGAGLQFHLSRHPCSPSAVLLMSKLLLSTSVQRMSAMPSFQRIVLPTNGLLRWYDHGECLSSTYHVLTR